MKTPVFDMISGYAAKRRASFHTPGHKGNFGPLNSMNIPLFDVTELPETSCLYGTDKREDAIELSEKSASETFGSYLTLFSAGGCTLCIQTMLLLGAGNAGGGRVLLARNSHVSAVHASALLGLNPVWVWPDDKSMQVSYSDVAAALASQTDIRAVYITSPDYYGNIADIGEISSLCRRRGIPLLVDNAHGSHLGAFGMHPLSLGADMTSDSSHKTLPVLTGGAMLHIGHWGKDIGIDRQSAKAAIMMFGSTSPSFPILASLDLALNWWREEGVKAYKKTAEWADRIAHTAQKHGIGVLKGRLRDPARLTLDTGALGVDGVAAAEYFGKTGCQPEYSDSRFVVFIITPFNTEEQLSRLNSAISGLHAALKRGEIINRPRIPDFTDYRERPVTALTPREALMSPCETTDVDLAAGRVAARMVCPCPPGIAAVVPGEIISPDMAKKLKNYGFKSLVVVKNR